jgi:hypothetical protein
MQSSHSPTPTVLAEKISQYIANCIKGTTIKIPVVSEGSNETTQQKWTRRVFQKVETTDIFL